VHKANNSSTVSAEKIKVWTGTSTGLRLKVGNSGNYLTFFSVIKPT